MGAKMGMEEQAQFLVPIVIALAALSMIDLKELLGLLFKLRKN